METYFAILITMVATALITGISIVVLVRVTINFAKDMIEPMGKMQERLDERKGH